MLTSVVFLVFNFLFEFKKKIAMCQILDITRDKVSSRDKVRAKCYYLDLK